MVWCFGAIAVFGPRHEHAAKHCARNQTRFPIKLRRMFARLHEVVDMHCIGRDLACSQRSATFKSAADANAFAKGRESANVQQPNGCTYQIRQRGTFRSAGLLRQM